MSESLIQWLLIPKLLAVITFAFLYSWGGLSGKWKRRFVAPSILVGTFFAFSHFAWLSLLSLPLLIGSLSLGYGGETNGEKILKRSYCGLAHCVALLPMFLVSQSWITYAVQCVFILISMIVFGVLNPTNARNEETIIGLTIASLPLFTI